MLQHFSRFSLLQKDTLGARREIEVDPQANKIRIHVKRPFKVTELILDLDDIDENTERVFQKAYGWLIASIFLMISFLFFLTLVLLRLPGLELIFLGLFTALFLSGFAFYRYIQGCFDRLIYFDFSRQKSFYILMNPPYLTKSKEFVTRLNELIIYMRQRRQLYAVIQAMPTDLLEEEFGLFYVAELLRRQEDVVQLLSAVKQLFLTYYLSEKVVGSTLN